MKLPSCQRISAGIFSGQRHRRPLALAISTLLFGGALTGTTQAQIFPEVVKLAELDGVSGFRLDGIESGDASGISVSSVGDINGDGIDDFIIGAQGAEPNSNPSAGSSFVVFGRDSGFPATLNLSTLDGSNGFRIDGVTADDLSGTSVSAAGDINGDGIDDLIIGAFTASSNGNFYAGSSYVVFGRDVATEGDFPATLNLSSLDGSSGFRIDGEGAGDYSGRRVSAAGDINGDGIDDLVIGASNADPNGLSNAGAAYVVFGRDVSVAGDFPATLALSSLDGSNGFRLDGADAGDQTGTSVNAAGDINGDGIDDLIVGAAGASPGDKFQAGSSFVVFGRDVSSVGNFPATLPLSDLDGSTGFRLDGEAEDRSGISVSAAGDINGDGIDDVIIGAFLASPNGITFSGSSFVVFGREVSSAGDFPAVLALSSLDGSTGFRMDGAIAEGRFGQTLASAGDINNDGIDDLIVGAFRADAGNISEAGQSYVIYGRNGSVTGNFPAVLPVTSLDGTNGFTLDGVAQDDWSGNSVSGAGDINDDGIDDVIIGASRADPNGITSSGSSYVVFGRGDTLFADRFELQ